jgi:hypothetical protein
VNRLGLRDLLFGPEEKPFRRELLGGLRRGVVQLPDHPIAVGMNVDAQLDALGFGCGLCCSECVGIGVGFRFQKNLGVARFRSPANTHAIYLVGRPASSSFSSSSLMPHRNDGVR